MCLNIKNLCDTHVPYVVKIHHIGTVGNTETHRMLLNWLSSIN
jgi:hypothetical protein